MKEFRKDQNGLFICEECGKTFKSKRGIGPHISKYHDSKKYFDKWLKTNTDGICLICRNPTIYISTSAGYKNCCSVKCKNVFAYESSKKSILDVHGVVNNFQRSDVKILSKKTKLEKYGDENFVNYEQAKKTKLEKYGDENFVNYKQAKKTKLEKYGDENFVNIKKRHKTNLIKYDNKYFANWEKSFETNLNNTGFKYTFQSDLVKNKSKKTNLIRYGVEYCQQNSNIHQKTLLSGLKIKKYLNTNLYYQGTYELDFLEKYYKLIPDLCNGFSIEYVFENQIRIYHPDFFIPSLNLIIEIKSSHWNKKNKDKDYAKKQGTLNANLNYLMILDKNYNEFSVVI